VTDLNEIRLMIGGCLGNAGPYISVQRKTALQTAAECGDLEMIHDILVRNLIELRGISFTVNLLWEIEGSGATREVKDSHFH
jgi:hypothetical protein